MKHLRKKYTSSLVVFALVLVVLGAPHLAWASDPGFMQNLLWGFVTNVFGTMAGLAGMLFNVSVNEYVIKFGENYLSGGVGDTVDKLWFSIRDVFNITFIFGLVYIGFKMILDSGNSNTQRWLVQLILAGLLVNFSLFFVKFVVDISNIVASEIAFTGFKNNLDGAGGLKITEVFADTIGFGSLVGTGSLKLDTLTTGAGAWGYIFGTMIIMVVMTFVFAAGAMLLLIRYVVLLIYMILSPFMFIGWVLPQMQKYTTEYWSGLLGRAFFAPLYLLFIFLSAEVLRASQVGGNGAKDFAGLTYGNAEAIKQSFSSTLPPFIIACVFLIASLVIAQKLGAKGADAAISAGKSLSNKFRRGLGNVTLGGGASLLRNTAGRGANAWANSDKGKDYAARSSFGKQLYKASTGVAKSSFDARAVGGLGSGLGIGTGQKGGYAKKEKDFVASEKKFADSLGKRDTKNEDGAYTVGYAEALAHEFNNDPSAVTERDNVRAATIDNDAKQASLQPKLDQHEENKKAQTDKVNELKEKLKVEEASATGSVDFYNIKKLKENIEEEEGNLATLDAKFAEDNKALIDEANASKAKVDKAKGDLKEAEKVVEEIYETKYVYGRQLDYMDQLKSSAKKWSGGGTAAGAGGVSTGVMIGGVAGAGLLVAGAAASARGAQSSAAAKAILEEYGKDGGKKVKKDKRLKNLKEKNEASADDEKSLATPEEAAPTTSK